MVTALFIFFNLFVLESLLSVDNAAVLAVMVNDLPHNQKKKALRYGIIGAYVLRGACLLAAAWLVKIIWLKIAGGIYLFYLAWNHFSSAQNSGDEATGANDLKVFRFAQRLGINKFWATVVLVEVMDLAFSIDNIFAAVALTKNIWLIMAGVFIGILAMRFVASWFVTLLEKYPILEKSAFIAVGLLGVKLVGCGVIDYLPHVESAKEIIASVAFDISFSALILSVFFIPPLLSKTK